MLATALLLTACPRPDGYRAVQVFPNINFDQMTGAYPIPGAGNFAAVLTKPGVIYRADLDNSAAAPSVFMDIRDRIIPKPEEEEGLLGLAFAPDFAASGRFYVYYSAGNPRRTVLSRFNGTSASGNPASEQVLLQIAQPFSNHKGGQLAFGPDGNLYIGVGDGGSGGDPMGNGQNTNTLLGKILRIDVSGPSYTIPADNPFAGGGGRPEIYSWGLRNPWRFSFDTQTGQLWAADVGQDRWEEVDNVRRGLNYGWNIMEGNHCFDPPSGCSMAGLALPRAEYSHADGCSITGGFVYRGSEMPETRGWYVYGDFCSGNIWAVNTGDSASRPVRMATSGLPITSFMQGKDGELYLVTFANAVYKIVRK
jgi:glucose/arabinose dehydrogenase